MRNHTSDQLGPAGDEYIPQKFDEDGEKKIMPDGRLLGNRKYRCRTFLVPSRGRNLFMLASMCAKDLGYRDSYSLFRKNRSLFKIVLNQVDKDDLVSQGILSLSSRSRPIAILTARSIFRQFGSRVVVNGRRVRDDYWEENARKQGFTEADLATEKRPGASRVREAAAAAAADLRVELKEAIHGNAGLKAPDECEPAGSPLVTENGIAPVTPAATPDAQQTGIGLTPTLQ
jgi:chromatin structure-remodeling complex protein RSC7